MRGHFNGLSPAEDERLALLLEELGEAIQAIGKIQRHGYQSCNPDDADGGDNRRRLQKELGDIHFAIQLMVDSKDVDDNEIFAAAKNKELRVQRYLHHQRLKRFDFPYPE